MANHGVLWHFRWWEAMLLHDDAAPPEGPLVSSSEPVGKKGSRLLVVLSMEGMLSGSSDRVEGGIVRRDGMHPADLITRSIRSLFLLSGHTQLAASRSERRVSPRRTRPGARPKWLGRQLTRPCASATIATEFLARSDRRPVRLLPGAALRDTRSRDVPSAFCWRSSR